MGPNPEQNTNYGCPFVRGDDIDGGIPDAGAGDGSTASPDANDGSRSDMGMSDQSTSSDTIAGDVTTDFDGRPTDVAPPPGDVSLDRSGGEDVQSRPDASADSTPIVDAPADSAPIVDAPSTLDASLDAIPGAGASQSDTPPDGGDCGCRIGNVPPERSSRLGLLMLGVGACLAARRGRSRSHTRPCR
jgi:hypothetical protein